ELGQPRRQCGECRLLDETHSYGLHHLQGLDRVALLRQPRGQCGEHCGFQLPMADVLCLIERTSSIIQFGPAAHGTCSQPIIPSRVEVVQYPYGLEWMAGLD